MTASVADLEKLRETWCAQWPNALALWSSYARLSDQRWCLNSHDAKREQLSGSFAMIRFVDNAVVLNLEEISDRGLAGFPLEVMGHEIGHHIYCPGDLNDHARMLVRVRRGLPGVEQHAPMIANLYADLFINNRLQRHHGLRLDRIYAQLGDGGANGSVLWRIYLRMYELLWQLDRGTLVQAPLTEAQEGDAQLGARLIRVYARDWLKGAASFGALCLSYLTEAEGNKLQQAARELLDNDSGDEGALPDGLSEIEADESEPVLHPSEDPRVAGDAGRQDADEPNGGGENTVDGNSDDPGGRKTYQRYRGVEEYRALLKQLSPNASDEDITVRYYRERALPYLIRFPEKESPIAREPIPEGLETWDMGRSFGEIDWLESITRSPHVVPGVTTLARVHGESPGQDPHKEPFDLYIGIDCSGSMPNPRAQLSYPVLAGFIIALSALRAGGRVMACLSGEPGKSIATDGFRRDQNSVLRLMTQYLGQGYSYGIFRLDDMAAQLKAAHRPVHLLIVTDTDIYSSLNEKQGKNGTRTGWDAAREALHKAGGGGTLLLHAPDRMNPFMRRFDANAKSLTEQGWRLAYISDWDEVMAFARNFAHQLWEKK